MHLAIRPFTPADAPACLRLFDSNTPEYFAPAERGEFAAYLASPGGGLLVAEVAGAGVVGVGGYYLRRSAAQDDGAEGGLAWGMVARPWHRRGVGRALLRARLAALRALGARTASVRTSQHSRGFFERAGFVVVRSQSDGFAPGIDLVELRLEAAGHMDAGADVAANTETAMPSRLTVRLIVRDPVPDVWLAVQRGRNALLAPAETTSAVATFEFELDAVIGADGRVTLRGPEAQGPPAGRFVYVNAGTYAGQAGTAVGRRAKVPLGGLDSTLVAAALARPGARVVGEIDGRARDGGPAAATVPLLGDGWTLDPGDT